MVFVVARPASLVTGDGGNLKLEMKVSVCVGEEQVPDFFPIYTFSYFSCHKELLARVTFQFSLVEFPLLKNGLVFRVVFGRVRSEIVHRVFYSLSRIKV